LSLTASLFCWQLSLQKEGKAKKAFTSSPKYSRWPKRGIIFNQWQGAGQPGTGGGVGSPPESAIVFTFAPFFGGAAFFVTGVQALAEMSKVGATPSE